MRVQKSASLGLALAAGLIAATLALPAAAAGAEPADDQSQCTASTGVSPEQKLASCTAVIAAGPATPQELAVAFTNRGNAYLSKRDSDHAIADFDEAIRLDPKYVFPLDGRGLAYTNKSQFDRAIQ